MGASDCRCKKQGLRGQGPSPQALMNHHLGSGLSHLPGAPHILPVALLPPTPVCTSSGTGGSPISEVLCPRCKDPGWGHCRGPEGLGSSALPEQLQGPRQAPRPRLPLGLLHWATWPGFLREPPRPPQSVKTRAGAEEGVWSRLGPAYRLTPRPPRLGGHPTLANPVSEDLLFLSGSAPGPGPAPPGAQPCHRALQRVQEAGKAALSCPPPWAGSSQSLGMGRQGLAGLQWGPRVPALTRLRDLWPTSSAPHSPSSKLGALEVGPRFHPAVWPGAGWRCL